MVSSNWPAMNEEDSVILPIHVGHECEILMANSGDLQHCQLEAFNSWIRQWRYYSNPVGQLSPQMTTISTTPVTLSTKNTCCYRWALLDCLTDSVQNDCPYAATFDLRYVFRVLMYHIFVSFSSLWLIDVRWQCHICPTTRCIEQWNIGDVVASCHFTTPHTHSISNKKNPELSFTKFNLAASQFLFFQKKHKL